MAVAQTNTLKPQLLVLKEGDFVFEEGDEAIFAYVLVAGTIEILQTVKGEPHVLGRVEKGTVFGEMAIIDGFARSASARAALRLPELDDRLIDLLCFSVCRNANNMHSDLILFASPQRTAVCI